MVKLFYFTFFLWFTITGANGQSIIIGSYNIRQANTPDSLAGNAWSRRCPIQAALIDYYDFDILGAQEVKHRQLMDLLQRLPGYDYIGVGRDDGQTKGEYSPIFYNKKRLKLIDSGHFWLGEDTSHPVKGWDATYVRICTWGKFKDRISGKTFGVFNLHTDHIGHISQLETSKLLLRKIVELCEKIPTFVTGDFNVDQYTEPYNILAKSGVLFDTYDIAKKRYDLNGTINHFDTNKATNKRIDHIFVSKGIFVESYAVLTDTYRVPEDMIDWIPDPEHPLEGKDCKTTARIPSDHFPVRVILNFKSPKNR